MSETSGWLSRRCFICGKTLDEENGIIINEEKGWFFCGETCLHKHFTPQIEAMAKDLEEHRKDDDIPLENIDDYSEALDGLLEEPAEIWEDTETFPEFTVHHFVGQFGEEKETYYYVAAVYMSADVPTFVFVHFPTKDANLAEHFRRGRLVFDREDAEIEVDATEDDALSEGDELAQGLFGAMLQLRQAGDIAETDFAEYMQYRPLTIEESDEMWRHTDLQGNNIVTFIRDFGEQDGEEFTYIVVTVEDIVSKSHFILFSFPTSDPNLVERFRQGQNLQEDAMTRGESH